MESRELRSIAFPKLSEAELASFGRCPLMVLKRYQAGETLFEIGDRNYNFCVVKSGEVEIVDVSGDAPKTVVVVHEPGEFTGEVAQVTGSPALVRAVVRRDSEIYEVSPEALRQLLSHHPELGDTILRAFIARRQLLREPGTFVGPRVIGSRYSQGTFRIRDFLSKNRVPFTWLDLEADPQVDALLKRFELSEADTPVVMWGGKLLLRNPTNRDLADALGLRHELDQTVYDLVVVGAGPAGLAAAVYGASEGLRIVVLERTAPGGQAGRSMRIENYLGFPAGITGGELAELAVMQVNKFGARLSIPTSVATLTFDNMYSVLHLDGDETVTTKCLLIATGADYRLLNVEGCETFEGRGVYYAATPIEAQMCGGSDVVVVGGGNSAGQAAAFLSGLARKVYIVIRGDDLYKSMSSYLVHRIEQTPNIDVLCNTEVKRMCGDGHLGAVEVINKKTGETRMLKVPAVFSFIGASPRTEWLPPEIDKDPKGFVQTGPSLAQSPNWSGVRQPFLLETSRRSVFAAGDVRSGSVKRVASSVGEGAMAVQFVHECLKEM
ncbi:MAG TPA: FAD-dependent oxidoreductase [Planctomycetaceae bacterium]|jgi:thioredoxin reductase (NADPH)|nr:FAD-dependent oxidoreductase [Planctomycetaceae bacterium]